MNEMMRITDSSISMTSREIAELTEKRHDNVKRTIETLSNTGVIQRPQIEEVKALQSLSPNNKTQVYVFSGEQGKRDSIIVVAQLSPEFTARLVDRWKELETRNAMLDTTTQLANAVILAQQVLQERQVRLQHLETKVEEDRPKVEFHDHVTTSDKWISMQDTAKQVDFIDVGRNKLFEILRKAKVLDRNNAPYQTYVDRGYFKEVPVPYGVDKVSQKTVVSYKGVAWIRKNLVRFGYHTHGDMFQEAA